MAKNVSPRKFDQIMDLLDKFFVRKSGYHRMFRIQYQTLQKTHDNR